MPGIEVPDNKFDQLSRNERFLRKLDQVILSEMANEQFGVEQLAEALSISRVQLYRKLHRITQKNVSQYIREYRLKKAMEMLRKDVASASEIAYLVGFSSPSYFNKCFHDFYGITPGSVVKFISEEEDSKKIKSIFSRKFPRDKNSIELNRIAELNKDNISSNYPDNETDKGIAQSLSKRTISTILFILILIITIVLMWRYIPDLFAPEESKVGSFLIDFKSGGDIYSGTNTLLTGTGLTKMSLEGRDAENRMTVEGAIQTGETIEGEPIYEDFKFTLKPHEAANYWGASQWRTTDKYTYDASYVKLRQLTLGYSLTKTVLSKTPFENLTISFVGRDLWIIHKNTPNIDPESSYTSSNSQGLDYFGMPSVRSWGFNLRMGF